VSTVTLIHVSQNYGRLRGDASYSVRLTLGTWRIEVGVLLAKVRATFPASGSKAKGWGEFLARVKIDDSTAVRYMEAARASSCPQDSAHSFAVSHAAVPSCS